MHEQNMQDPNLLLIQMPFLDMLNHSRNPNVGIFPFIDTMDDNSSHLILRALRDIEPDEQLTVSYGNLSNMHFI